MHKTRDTLKKMKRARGGARVRLFARFLSERTLNLVFVYPTDQWELGGTLITYIVAWAIIKPGDDLLPPTVYDLITNTAPEWAWGLAVLAIALISTAGIFFEKFDALRCWGATLEAVMWITLSNAFFVAPEAKEPLALIFGVIAAMWGLAALRLWLVRWHFPGTEQIEALRFRVSMPFHNRAEGEATPQAEKEAWENNPKPNGETG